MSLVQHTDSLSAVLPHQKLPAIPKWKLVLGVALATGVIGYILMRKKFAAKKQKECPLALAKSDTLPVTKAVVAQSHKAPVPEEPKHMEAPAKKPIDMAAESNIFVPSHGPKRQPGSIGFAYGPAVCGVSTPDVLSQLPTDSSMTDGQLQIGAKDLEKAFVETKRGGLISDPHVSMSIGNRGFRRTRMKAILAEYDALRSGVGSQGICGMRGDL